MFKKLKYFSSFMPVVFLLAGLVYFGASHGAKAQVSFDLANLRNQDQGLLLTLAYDNINIQQAWEEIIDSGEPLSKVVIGIVDTGINISHREFKNPDISTGHSPSSAFVDLKLGGHGTQVAGIIGANNLSDSGTTLNPDSPQMNGILSGVLQEDEYTLEIENYYTKNNSAQISAGLAGLEDMIESDIEDLHIINLSFGMPLCEALSSSSDFCSKTLDEFIRLSNEYEALFRANEEKILFVAGAGNYDINAGFVNPARLGLLETGNVITVGATSFDNSRAGFSDFGPAVQISAPGDNVYAPAPPDAYNRPGIGPLGGIIGGFSGTSASAPFVTGVAGLIKAIQPGFTPERIKSVLTNSADPIKTGEPQKTMGNTCHSNPDPT